MIVVDTNIIAYLCIGGDLAPLAEAVLMADSDWHAPFLWRSEFRSVVAGFLRRGVLDSAMALRILDEAEVLLSHHEHVVDSHDVLRLVESSSCSAYDCEYVTLAEQLEVPLVTNDREVLRSFSGTAASMQSFLDRAPEA